MNQFAQIKADHSIQDEFRKDGHKLIGTGEITKCLCPFHIEKTPSCTVYSDHFYCFGCGEGGDVIDYLCRRYDCNKAELLKRLKGEVQSTGKSVQPKQIVRPPVVEEEKPDFAEMIYRWAYETTDDQVIEFSNQLNVDYEALCCLQPCWAPQYKMWAFPMISPMDEIVGIRLRGRDGRKLSVKGSKDGLFIPPIDIEMPVMICEGPTDTAAALTLNYYAIGRANANGVSCMEQAVAYIRKHNIYDVILVMDNDAAGMKSAKKFQELLKMRCRRLLLPTKDFREFLKQGASRALINSMLNHQLIR